MMRFLLILFSIVVSTPSWAATERFVFDPDLSIEMITFPAGNNYSNNNLSLGFIFRNNARQRQIALDMPGIFDKPQKLTIPAKEKKFSVYYYFPESSTMTHRVNITDLETGRSQRHDLPQFHRSPGFVFGYLDVLNFTPQLEDRWAQPMGALAKKLPDSWRGLQRFSMISVNYDTWLKDKNLHEVVGNWVLMGGRLVVIRSPKTDLTQLKDTLPFSTYGDSNTINAGLGQLRVVDANFLEVINNEDAAALQLVAPSDPSLYVLAEHLAKELLEIGRIPVWTIFVLLIVFTLVVGPIGWRALIKKRARPFLYLASVMGTASVFIVGLITATLISDGIVPISKEHSLHFIDQQKDRELHFVEASVFSPTAYGTHIIVPRSAQLMSLDIQNRYYLNKPLQFSHTGNNQKITGLIDVRRRTIIAARRASKLDHRLLVHKDNGELIIENHLSHDLEKIWVFHAKATYVAQNVARGTRTRLTLTTRRKGRYATDIPIKLLDKATGLLASFEKGKFTDNYFVGKYKNVPSGFFESVRSLGDVQHIVAGTF